jgi:hypothetical protein
MPDQKVKFLVSVRLGGVGGIDTGTRGTLYFDAFHSQRQTAIGGGYLTPAQGGSAVYLYDGDGRRVKETAYTNLATGLVPTGDVTLTNAGAATDGDTWANSSSEYASTASGLHYLQVDLGAKYRVDKIKVWHYANDGRTYHNTKTQVSADGSAWTTVYDSATAGEYKETAAGKTHSFAAQGVRYVRDYLNGNTVNAYNHWVELEVWGTVTTAFVGDSYEYRLSSAASGAVNVGQSKYYFAGGQRVSMRREGYPGPSTVNGLFFLLADHLGSTSVTLRLDGGALTKISELRYKPWGEPRPSGYAERSSLTSHLYTGQAKQELSGLYFYQTRYGLAPHRCTPPPLTRLPESLITQSPSSLPAPRR